MEAKEDQHLTRATLLERLKVQHDDKSWDEFVTYYRHFLYIICRRMNLEHHDAEEVVQKVLLKIWNKLPDFEYDSNRRFRSWLYQVTRNSVRDYCRKQTRDRKLIEKAMEYEVWDADICESSSKLEAQAEKEWANYITNMALVNIKPHFSERVMDIFMRLINGAEAKEVSEELGIPRNTVNVYKKRVTARLKEEVARLQQDLD